MKKITVGQEVFVEGIGNRIKMGIVPSIVTKVGNIYFYVDNFPHERFLIFTLMQDSSGYSPYFRVWLSKQEVEEGKEAIILRKKIKIEIDHACKISIEQLRAISAILFKPEETK